MILKEISANTTRPLRHSILRPNQTLADCIYPGDDDKLSFHVGAYMYDQLICVASFFPQSTERLAQPKQYRLRGMGTSPAFRAKGIGAMVLKKGEDIARERGYDILWCNARTSASGYYLKQGYTAFDDEFEIEGIGPHYVMWKMLGS
jgi:GNAT superfamily N-acetyltransferase